MLFLFFSLTFLVISAVLTSEAPGYVQIIRETVFECSSADGPPRDAWIEHPVYSWG